jgi:hypothetical protein
MLKRSDHWIGLTLIGRRVGTILCSVSGRRRRREQTDGWRIGLRHDARNCSLASNPTARDENWKCDDHCQGTYIAGWVFNLLHRRSCLYGLSRSRCCCVTLRSLPGPKQLNPYLTNVVIHIYMNFLIKSEILTSYIYELTFGNAESCLCLFAAQCLNTESMQKVILCHSCV